MAKEKKKKKSGCLGFIVILVIIGAVVASNSGSDGEDKPQMTEEERQQEAQRKKAEAEKQQQIDKEFIQSAKDAGWVTYIEQSGTDFHVRLPLEKYTSKENVKSIAESIAKSYVMQSKNKGGSARNATVHVWQGNDVLVRGSYRD